MNRLLALALLFITFTTVYGQDPLNIGIKFGTNRSTMITDIDDVLNQNILYEDVNNYLVGAFARASIGRLYVQPEVYFNTKGGNIQPYGTTNDIQTNTSFNYQTIDLPVLAGIKLINRSLINFRIHGGPVFSYITTSSLITEINNFDANDLKERYMGWQIGAGIDFWFLTVDARIENSANILNDQSQFQARNRTYLISAGIKLF
ncbi:MAG: PorT family protein [Prolixibacteraceae bacterium]|nr:PorT family protein [Prolixibacteraceae bacterium]